jgi:hypothetical protein
MRAVATRRHAERATIVSGTRRKKSLIQTLAALD